MSESVHTALVRDYLRSYFEYQPEYAFFLGLHEYAGRIGDPSRAASDARIARLQDFQRGLAAVEREELSETQRFDLDLVRGAVEYELYSLEDLREREWNPMAYLGPTGVSSYAKRSYAPLEDRVQHMTAHLRGVPGYLAIGLENLRPDLARPVLEASVEAFDGQVAYLRGEARQSVEDVSDETLLREFDAASQAAADALEEFTGRLRERLPDAHGDFAIGTQSYERMLSTGEMVDMSVQRVLEVGMADLRRNQELLRETANKIAPGADVAETVRALGKEHPTADQLIPETADMLEELRSFIIEREIATVPSEVRCKVEETPPFMRWAFAAMDPPGPFETVATEAYYYVTPVEPEWSPEKQEEWLSRFDYYTLRDVSVHEAYPGHYLHFLHLQQAPSDASKALISYAFTEGWAHYCEQMMVEAGYRDHDPKLQLAQLIEALLRDCRYIVSILMHTQGMSVEDATRFLMHEAYMEELPASREAQRGTFDPGYLYYTLGKLMLLKLREDYERERGADFNLHEFHDRCLSYGAPPVPLLRRQMLTDASGPAL